MYCMSVVRRTRSLAACVCTVLSVSRVFCFAQLYFFTMRQLLPRVLFSIAPCNEFFRLGSRIWMRILLLTMIFDVFICVRKRGGGGA